MPYPLVIERSDITQPLHTSEGQQAEHGWAFGAPSSDRIIGILRPGNMVAAPTVRGNLVPHPADPRHIQGAAGVNEPLLRCEGHGWDHRLEVRRGPKRPQPP